MSEAMETTQLSRWDEMATEAKADRDDEVIFAKVREEISELMALQQATYGQQHEQPVPYRQKDHWAILDLIAYNAAIAQNTIRIAQLIEMRLTAVEATLARLPCAKTEG